MVGLPDVDVPAEQSIGFSILIVGVLVILTLGLGCTLSLEDARRACRTPRAPLAGVLSQYLFLPLLGFTLASIFDFPPYVSLGLLITTSCPGGTTSNFFSHLAAGDVALSVVMTVASVLLAFGMLPMLVYLYGSVLLKDADVHIPFLELFLTLLAVAVPCLAGIALRSKSKLWAKRVEVFATGLGLLFLIGAVVVGFIENIGLLRISWQYWLTAFLILPCGFTAAATLALCVGLPGYQARTVGFEVGVQDTILAIAIVRLSFRGEQMVHALVFPLMCSLFDVVNSFIILAGIRAWVHNFGTGQRSPNGDDVEALIESEDSVNL